jgi:hypothetical protein
MAEVAVTAMTVVAVASRIVTPMIAARLERSWFMVWLAAVAV